MINRGNAARMLGLLLSGLLTHGASAWAADEAPVMVDAAAPEPAAVTLRDAIALAAQHFDFTVIGANRLGTEAPVWPAEDRGPRDMLATLLKGYSYVVLLKPEAGPDGGRAPQTVMIAGLYHPQAELMTPAPLAYPRGSNPLVATYAPAVTPAPASADYASSGSRPPTWAQRPSTVVRALTQMATTNGANPGEEAAAASAAAANPAQNADAMAALTRSAQTGLGALVIGLRQACPTPKSC
jgi:hypothetical protein